MRPYQVFARLEPDLARKLLGSVLDDSPAVFGQVVHAASAALKARPVYLMRQPREKKIDAVRRTLSRVSADALAEEMLATYFIECRKPLLIEWLDCVGVEHEDGLLKNAEPPEPEAAKLKEAVETFRAGEDPPERELLLQAFAAQSAIDWPGLEALLKSD